MTTGDQRMVPVTQLTELADCLEAMATGKGGWAWADVLDDLRAIIAGPEVEPVAAAVLSYNAATDWYDVISADHNILRPLCKKHAQGMATLYSSTSTPAARCHECGKLASDGWALYCVECAEKIAPVQTVPDGWSIEPYGDNGIALRNGEEWDEFYPTDTVRMDFVFRLLSAMLASTPQPDTTQPSAVACPTDKEK